MSEKVIDVAHLQELAKKARVSISIKEEEEAKKYARKTEEAAQELARLCIRSLPFTLESAAKKGKYSVQIWEYVKQPFERRAAEIVVQRCKGLGLKAEIRNDPLRSCDCLIVSWEK